MPHARIRALAVALAVGALLLLAPLALLSSGGATSAVPPAGSGIPAVYMPIYAVAERTFRVNRFLLAAIHFQETRFSTLRSPSLAGDAVTGGWNACGAAG